MPVTHSKTVTINDPTQDELDERIAAGQYPPGTTLAVISLASDWNDGHVVSISVSEINATGTPSASTFLRGDGSWAAGGGGGTWGSITGTLSDQTDLQTALDAKAPTASPTFTGVVQATTIQADTSSVLVIESSSGADVLLAGAGGGANATAYGGWDFDAATASTIASFGASKTLESLS